MYVCMYVYVRTFGVKCVHVSARSCTCACNNVHMTYICIRICILGFMSLACVGPAMRATRAYIHTYDGTAHCATVARCHRYLGRMSPHVRTYAHIYLGFSTCLAQMILLHIVLLQHNTIATRAQ